MRIIMDNPEHPLHNIVIQQQSIFSQRLLQSFSNNWRLQPKSESEYFYCHCMCYIKRKYNVSLLKELHHIHTFALLSSLICPTSASDRITIGAGVLGQCHVADLHQISPPTKQEPSSMDIPPKAIATAKATSPLNP